MTLNIIKACGGGLTEDTDESLQQNQIDFANVQHAFETKVYDKGWQVRGDTPADGNCLFWAVSDQLDKNGCETFTHTQLRSNAISYIKNSGQVCIYTYTTYKMI